MGELRNLLITLSDTSHYHSTKVTSLQVNILKKMISTWEPAKVFPAYDVLRLVAIHPGGVELLTSSLMFVDILTRLRNLLRLDTPTASVLTMLRYLNNTIRQPNLRKILFSNQANLFQILDTLSDFVSHDSNPIRMAVSSIALNTAIGICEASLPATGGVFGDSSSAGIMENCLASLLRLARAICLADGRSSIESYTRAVIIIGMAVSAKPSSRQVATDLQLANTLRQLKLNLPDSSEYETLRIYIDDTLLFL